MVWLWFGLVWADLAWLGFGLIWFGLVWADLVWLGLGWFGLDWFGLTWLGCLGLDDLIWLVLVWLGANMVWLGFGLIWSGFVWADLVWLGLKLFGYVCFYVETKKAVSDSAFRQNSKWLQCGDDFVDGVPCWESNHGVPDLTPWDTTLNRASQVLLNVKLAFSTTLIFTTKKSKLKLLNRFREWHGTQTLDHERCGTPLRHQIK